MQELKLKYSRHLNNRLSLRKIEYKLAEKIFYQAKERYLDVKTGYLIATMKVNIYDKLREVMLAYIISGDIATLLTIHPLKKGQKERRLKTGRWRKYNE